MTSNWLIMTLALLFSCRPQKWDMTYSLPYIKVLWKSFLNVLNATLCPTQCINLRMHLRQAHWDILKSGAKFAEYIQLHVSCRSVATGQGLFCHTPVPANISAVMAHTVFGRHSCDVTIISIVNISSVALHTFRLLVASRTIVRQCAWQAFVHLHTY